MDRPARAFIIALRIAATLVGFVTIVALWDVMTWLPWHVDAILAGLAVLAFAYRYEREEQAR